MDYTKRKEYEIGKLIEQGVLKENSRMGNHIYVYKFNSDEIILKLNDNLEVILENKPLFMNLDNFDLETIPIELRPNKEELRRPTSIQEYYVLNDGNYGHVFTCKGKYLSSHKGWYNEFFSLNGLHRKLKFRRLYVPVGEFQEDGVAYYVRLTDGFEYRK